MEETRINNRHSRMNGTREMYPLLYKPASKAIEQTYVVDIRGSVELEDNSGDDDRG